MTARVLLVALLAVPACPAPEPPSCDGERLFGRPTEATGLSSDQCAPSCACSGETWEAPAYTPADADALLAWQLLDPPAPLTSDPYDRPAEAPADGDPVCAVLSEGEHRYRLGTRASPDEAEREGAHVSHFGACGVCSTLADLAVYMRFPDLTEPVRACGLDHLTGTPEEHTQCLRDLGFTEPCAQIWYYNTLHTRSECASECFSSLDATWHLPDGSLNPCLQCDEVESGPVFKAVAGRTRRNTGLASSMCRPCSEVRPVRHDYAP